LLSLIAGLRELIIYNLKRHRRTTEGSWRVVQ
jgi:hypothetical protein